MSLDTHALHGMPSVVDRTKAEKPAAVSNVACDFPWGSTSSKLDEEIYKLLKIRLRAVALFCLVGSIAFLLGQWTVGISKSFDHHWQLYAVLFFTIGAFAGVVSVLQLSKDPCLKTLRIVEVLTFVILCNFLAFILYFETLDMGHPRKVGDPPVTQWTYITNTGAPWMIAVFGYSLFIPNHWRRTLVINSLLTMIPVSILCLMMGFDLEVRKVFVNSNLNHLLFDFLLVLGAATYGSWLMNSMHKEAVEARQLGQYSLVRKLGGGGMGEVYLAEHQMLKRPCAVKIIRPEQNSDPKMLLRFEKEVRNMAQLSHWNTVEVYDYGMQNGIFYYAMEYLPGWTLHDMVERYGPLPPDRVIHFLRQTCDALYEAHTFGLMHRDIKPGNVVVSQRGGFSDVTKLLDFGLVKKLGEGQDMKLTQDGIVTGTPHYMSPEQATGRDIDGRSDLYSLGAVGFFLLTGQPPFNLDEPIQILMAHLNTPVPQLSDLREDVPFDLEQVILRCLAKRPEDRYEHARALEAALAKCKDANKWTQARAKEWWDKHSGEAPTQPIQEGYQTTSASTPG
jgi:serine/threonine-protein kinase